MRIIKPSRKRKTGSKAKPSESPDSSVESGDFAYVDKGRTKNNKSEKKSSTKGDVNLTKGLSLKTEPVAEPSEFSDGRKRRRSEFGEVSFFTKKDGKAEKVELGTEKSEALSDDELAELFAPLDDKKKEFNRLLASGMRLLGMREHSVKELTAKLLKKTELNDVAHAVVDELLEEKYLSDERFAEGFVRYRTNKGFGPIKIRSELKNRGVSSQLIADYLDMNSAVWFDIASDQHDKKYGDDPIDDYNAWTKRARFLQGRGFTMEHIHCAVIKPESY